MNWNRGLPSNEDLHVVFKRGGYEVLGGTFIVWNGTSVGVSQFQRPQKDSPGDWYSGYWANQNVVAWMKMPEQPNEDNHSSCDGYANSDISTIDELNNRRMKEWPQ